MSYNKELHKLKYIKERFEAKFIPEPNSGCWLWTATTNQDGYGRFRYKDRLVGAHRFSLMVYREQENQELCVLHTCDGPCCVNPNHLFFGTHTDNMRDRKNKGRGFVPAKKGVEHYKAKFTEVDIVYIRQQRMSGKTNVQLAGQFGVCSQTISNIIVGKTWKHI